MIYLPHGRWEGGGSSPRIYGCPRSEWLGEGLQRAGSHGEELASREWTFTRGAGPSPPCVPAVQVIRRIRASGPRVLLTVLAQHVHEVARAQRGNNTHLCPPLGQGVRPRLCHVVKDEGGFGFSVTQGELRAREGSAGGP